MYERILVPLDGTDLAEQALPYAREIATKFGSHITLLRAIHTSQEALRDVAAEPTAVTAPEVTTDVARNLHESEAGTAREYVRRIAETFDGSGLDVETQMVEGDPEWVIENQAKELRSSLIVMATHARTGLGRLLHGSVADELVRSSTVPVMLIRTSES